MNFHTAQLVQGQPTSGEECSVTSQASMGDVFQKTAGGCYSFLFVEDERGNPIGIIHAEDILRRITDPSPFAFSRWMEMPVEAALQSRIELPRTSAQADQETKCIKVSQDGNLLGVVTEDDVLISWRSIQKTLMNSLGDGITGLPNRSAFDHHITAECNRGQRYHHSVAVILVDLDNFKQINDQFGHAAGDTALGVIATTLRQALRSYDLVARFGGDEFAVICSGCRPGEIDIVLRRIRESVLRLHEDPTVPRPIPTVSVGACVAHDMNMITHPAQIIEVADECLYAAKQAGRNCVWKHEIMSGGTGRPEFVESAAASDLERFPSC